MGEEIKNLYCSNVTIISNEFFEKYLGEVNPEFLRVYLYFVWKGKEKISFEDVANELNLTINDVERAVKYWNKQKVLAAKNNKVSKTIEITTEDVDDNKNIKTKQKEDSENIYTIEANFLKKNKQNKKFKTNSKEYEELLTFAEQMFPNISNLQVNLFRQLYYEEGMPIDLLEYLIEYCAERGATNTSYVRKVATNWLESGFKTVDEAKNSALKINRSKKSKSVVRKINASQNNSTNSDWEKMFLEKSAKKGLK